MASAMSFFKGKENKDDFEGVEIKKKEKEIQRLKWYIIDADTNVQKTITDYMVDLVSDEEALNDKEYDSFADFIKTFELLEVVGICNWKVEFKFNLYTENYSSQLPVNIFHEIMISKKLLDIDEKEDVTSTRDNVSDSIFQML